MSFDDVYGNDRLAAGYATSRPPIHARILHRVASVHPLDQIDFGVDVGCGAGLSTAALIKSGLARRALGVDRSPPMIRQARRHVEEASFILAAAEALPLQTGSVGLMTAAGSVNYTDIPAFFSEGMRVLSPGGLLLVYDFASGCSSIQQPGLAAWHSEMLRRWPKPARGVQGVGLATFESAPMDLVSHERFTVSVDFELDDYLDYLMTESNIWAVATSDAERSEIRSWCEKGLRQLFPQALSVEFDSYYAWLSQPK